MGGLRDLGFLNTVYPGLLYGPSALRPQIIVYFTIQEVGPCQQPATPTRRYL